MQDKLSSGNQAWALPAQPPNLDAALAFLHEMIDLQQLDLLYPCSANCTAPASPQRKGGWLAASSLDCPDALKNGFFQEEEGCFQEQNSSRDGRDQGPPRDLSLPVSPFSSSDWILESI